VTWRAGWYVDCAPRSYIVESGALLAVGGYYFEITLVAAPAGTAIMFGVASSTVELYSTCLLAYNVPQSRSQYCVLADAEVGGGGGLVTAGYPSRPVGTTSQLATPSVYGVALDTVHHKIWWKNITAGSTWSGAAGAGDPATNVNGCDLSASGPSPVINPLYIIVGACNNSRTSAAGTLFGKGTLNFGATAFTGTAPSGFFSVESAYPGAQLSASRNSNVVLTNNNLTFEANAHIGTGQTFYGLIDPDWAYAAINCVLTRFAFLQA